MITMVFEYGYFEIPKMKEYKYKHMGKVDLDISEETKALLKEETMNVVNSNHICRECTEWLRNIHTDNYRDYLGNENLDDFMAEKSINSLIELASYVVRYENGMKSLLKFRRDMNESDNYTYRVIPSNESNEEYLVLMYI